MFQDVSEYYLARKGAKFQNLHYCYQQWPERLAVMRRNGDGR